MMKLTAKSYSKINVFLNIKRKRKDGYHELESIFLPLEEPADKITITPSKKLEIICCDQQIPDNEDNICWKAAELYATQAGIKPEWCIEIEKNIPVAAGMGGGSSNAATVLNLLQKKYNALPQENVLLLAKEIGADVPFFIDPKPAVARGIGEKLTEIKIKGKPVFLVISPLFPVSTQWAYQNLSLKKKKISAKELNTKFSSLLDCIQQGKWSECREFFYNDFTGMVFNKFPLMENIKDFLINHNFPPSTMSGSGPTLFLLLDNLVQAKKIKKKLTEKYGDALKSYVSMILKLKTKP